MNKEQSQDDEIDLIALIKQLWLSKVTVIKTAFGFLILGVLVALLSPTVYAAASTFIPQSSRSIIELKKSGLSSWN